MPGSPAPAPRDAKQVICRECGDPFLSSSGRAIVCGKACTARRVRRRKRQGGTFTEWASDFSHDVAEMEKATSQALDDLPNVARDVLAEQIRPAIDKALVQEGVLESLAAMVGLMPRVVAGLAADLDAMKFVYDFEGKPVRDADGEHLQEPDQDTRNRAKSHLLKYTAGMPGLAPQPEAQAMAPLVVNFTGMQAMVAAPVDASVVELIAEVEAGTSRVCDSCGLAKPVDEFVGGSERCQECHGKVRERAMLRLAPAASDG